MPLPTVQQKTEIAVKLPPPLQKKTEVFTKTFDTYFPPWVTTELTIVEEARQMLEAPKIDEKTEELTIVEEARYVQEVPKIE